MEPRINNELRHKTREAQRRWTRPSHEVDTRCGHSGRGLRLLSGVLYHTKSAGIIVTVLFVSTVGAY